MKKIFKYLLPFIMIFTSCGPMIEKFEIEIQEGISEPIEIKKDDYLAMIENKKSFIIYISSSTCSSCKQFNPKLNSVIEELSIIIYKIESYQIKEYVNYHATPAIAVIKEGELVHTINMDENPSHFKSASSIEKYILRYIKI